MRNCVAGIMLGLLILTSVTARSQDSVVVTDGFRAESTWSARKVISGIAVGGVLGGSLVSSYFDWWNGQGRKFHLFSEGWFGDYALGIDKAGHTYTSYFYFHAFRNLMLWGGFQPSTAFWWAAGTTAFFAVSIEIGDGFSPYGFSFEDLAANSLGLGYAMLQTKYDLLKNINLKWSYFPSDGFRWPPHFTDHYDAHTYWLTFNLHNLLPGKIGESWPEFLQLAVGYGVDDHVSKREMVIGLDLNLGGLSFESRDLHLATRVLDMFHYPLPAVEFTQGKGPRAYMFYKN
jgi:hypothetical protein